MTTTIEINRLRLYAFHGVLPREREVGNEFEVTLHLECDMTEAMTCARLDGTRLSRSRWLCRRSCWSMWHGA